MAAVDFDIDPLQDLNDAARRILGDHARAFDKEYERRCAAVHDRNLGAFDLDNHVVDETAGQRGKQMLDRRDGDAVLVSECRAEGCFDDVLDESGDFGAVADLIGAEEDNTGVRGGRLQQDRDGLARVQAGAAAADLALERVLQARVRFR